MVIPDVPFDPHATRCVLPYVKTPIMILAGELYTIVHYAMLGNRGITDPPPGMLGFLVGLVFTHFPPDPFAFLSFLRFFSLLILHLTTYPMFLHLCTSFY